MTREGARDGPAIGDTMMMVARSARSRTITFMIRLTRLRSPDPLYVNPDHIERLDRHHDTIVHLLNGDEYIVVESPEEIVERITYLRAKVIALAARLAADGLAELGDALTATAAASEALPRVTTDEEG